MFLTCLLSGCASSSGLADVDLGCNSIQCHVPRITASVLCSTCNTQAAAARLTAQALARAPAVVCCSAFLIFCCFVVLLEAVLLVCCSAWSWRSCLFGALHVCSPVCLLCCSLAVLTCCSYIRYAGRLFVGGRFFVFLQFPCSVCFSTVMLFFVLVFGLFAALRALQLVVLLVGVFPFRMICSFVILLLFCSALFDVLQIFVYHVWRMQKTRPDGVYS